MLEEAREISRQLALPAESIGRLAVVELYYFSETKTGTLDQLVAACAAGVHNTFGLHDLEVESCVAAYVKRGRALEALAFLEQVFRGYSAGVVGEFFVPQWKRLAPIYAELLMLTRGGQSTERAFELVDRTRSSTLLTKLGLRTRNSGAVADDLALIGAAESRLSEEAQGQLGRTTKDGAWTAEQLADRAQILRRELLMSKEQGLRAEQAFDAAPPKIPQGVLDSETVLLEYLLRDDKSYVWVVSTTAIQSFELPSQKVIAFLVERSLKYWSTPGKALTGAASPGDDIFKLGQILIKPAAKLIRGKRLLIVPDGVLERLPFAALPDPNSLERNPLVEGHEVTYIPSATALEYMRKVWGPRKVPVRSIAMIADPVFSSTDLRLNRNMRSVGGREKMPSLGISESALARAAIESGLIKDEKEGLSRLPFTRQEAKGILSYAKANEALRALDFDANLSMVVSGRLAQYRIVHFATHGLLNQSPELSGLALSLVNERGDSSPGFLKLYDIYKLDLPAELVVLSACQTAAGLRSGSLRAHPFRPMDRRSQSIVRGWMSRNALPRSAG